MNKCAICMSTDIPTTVGVMADGSKVYICTECWQSETPKIICLCGSTKFKKEFEETELELTLEGKIVLTVGGFMHADVLAISEEQKRGLDRLHKRKIELSDMVLVLNVGGYIGESTMSEVEYAIRCRKPVVYKYPTQ